MTILGVQYASDNSASGRPPGGLPLIPAVTTLAVVAIAAFLFIRDWRRSRGRASSTLIQEAERWLRDQPA